MSTGADATSEPSGSSRPGMLLVLMEPPAPLEEEFNDWYDTEHLPQRRSLPGFVSGSRWTCIHGWPRWGALYDLTTVGAIDTPEYRAVSGHNGTPWSRRILPRTIGRVRVVAEAVAGSEAYPSVPPAATRLAVIRFPLRGGAPEAEVLLREGRDRLVQAGALQVRALQEEHTNPEPKLWLIAAFDHPVAPDHVAASVGRLAGIGAELLNVYVPYRRA